MIFPSIDIQGSILSNDILGKIRGEQATYQQGKEFAVTIAFIVLFFKQPLW